MEVVTSSNVLADRAIFEALSPHVTTPFGDLLYHAQEMINGLKESTFFNRYLQEKITEQSQGRNFLRLARDDRRDGTEWFILTLEGKLKFWLVGSGSLYSFSDTVLIRSATGILQQMTSPMATMRELITLFGAPSFTAEDVQKELTRNGNINLLCVSLNLAFARELGKSVATKITQFQFEVEDRSMNYVDFRVLLHGLPETIKRNHANASYTLVVLVLESGAAEFANNLYRQLPPEVTQRLWLYGKRQTFHDDGFDRELLQHPLFDFDAFTKLSDFQLITMLEDAFRD